MMPPGVIVALLTTSASLSSVVAGLTGGNTLTEGWIITSILILIFGGYVGMRDRRSKKWRDLYELADAERKERQHERDEALAQLKEAQVLIAEQKSTIAKLDALQMPVRIVELMNDVFRKLEEGSDNRANKVSNQVREALLTHENRAADRFEQLIKVVSLIADRLGSDPSDYIKLGEPTA